MSHELTHQVICDMASKQDRLFRSILGGKAVADNRGSNLDGVQLFHHPPAHFPLALVTMNEGDSGIYGNMDVWAV